jgi:hypothetical protein
VWRVSLKTICNLLCAAVRTASVVVVVAAAAAATATATATAATCVDSWLTLLALPNNAIIISYRHFSSTVHVHVIELPNMQLSHLATAAAAAAATTISWLIHERIV